MTDRSDTAAAPGAAAGSAMAATPAPVGARPDKGQELQLRIDSLAFGGDGVGRWGDSGYVVFVGETVPGDLVSARVTRRKRSYAHARLVSVIEPAPERIPARAGHPGAPWQVLPYERQLQVKQDQVGEALRRLGGLHGFALEPIVAAGQQWRYRNKLEYSFGSDEDGRLVCGFHEPGSWSRIVPMDDCLLASEPGNAVRRRVLQLCREQGLSARDRRSGDGLLRNLVVREGRRSGQLQVRLVTDEGELDAAALAAGLDVHSLLWTRTSQLGETTAGGRTELIAGEPQLDERLGDLELRVSPEAFFQTNTEMAEVLYGAAAEYADLAGWERVFDLYCGIGTIGLFLAPRAGELWGLEIVPEALADAAANAQRNGITNARFVAGDARLALPDLVARAGRPDVLVVDPPRAGLSPKIVRRVIEAAPKRIVYVSCNPSTLAPNAAQLGEAGYRLVRVRPVDMFPQTPHIECVALLERG